MRFQVETSASPEVVFSEVADFARLESWDPLVRRSWLEEGQPLHEAAVYVFDAPAGLRLRYRIIDIEQPKFVVYRGGTERVRSTDTIEITETHGGSRITVTGELRFEGQTRMFGPLITALVWLSGRLLSVPAMRRHMSTLS